MGRVGRFCETRKNEADDAHKADFLAVGVIGWKLASSDPGTSNFPEADLNEAAMRRTLARVAERAAVGLS
jgi:hypothetical protein